MILALAIAGLFVLPDPWRIVVVIVAALIEVGEVYFWIRFLRRYRVTTGAEGLVGQPAEVLEPPRADQAGRVRAHGEIWSARCQEAVEIGDEVRIVAVEGLTLVVAPARG